jgi:hypothetical protein
VGQEKVMSDTRRRGIVYLKKRLGCSPLLIATSKFFRDKESWTGEEAWWFDLPIEKVKAGKNGIYYLVGESKKSSFVVLKVPNKFLIANLKKFETRYQGRIRLHLSAESSDRLVDKRGKGQVDFSRFELNV